ncbi:plant UBX domain-containing protein 8-like [Aristolochia californica]|uniref:plant UBX domain-containing protein 8-like n=1 Tax=Aristolochia californica TaxID=171875 RepID=UPI0035E08F6B
MARPQQDAIETFMSITGASEAVALQKLEEHGGDLNRAINAHFNEGDQNISHPTSIPEPQEDLMAVDDQISVEQQPPFPLLPSSRSLNPFALLDPNFGRSFFDGVSGSDLTTQAPRVSHPREVREIPIEVKDGDNLSSQSGPSRPIIEDVTESTHPRGPEIHGTVIVDEEEEKDENLPINHPSTQSETTNEHNERHRRPSVPRLDEMADDGNDIEEEMLRAAIEASKHEAEGGYHSQQFGTSDDPSVPLFEQRSSHSEDAELARAVSLSLKTAEQEKALREQKGFVETAEEGAPELSRELTRLPTENGRQVFGPSSDDNSSQFKLEPGSSSILEEIEDVEDEPLVRNRSKRVASGSVEPSKEAGPMVDSQTSGPESQTIGPAVQHNGDAFHSDMWGGMSSEEHDEAVMLEAALFGGIPEGTAYQFGYSRRVPRSPSPTLAAQRLLREQQDDEYLASLQADREKELKAKQEAEAALEQEKRMAEEAHRKLLEEEEFEKQLVAKEASLPQEPASEDENAVTLLVRMPDGTRRGRRFRKTDKLQCLFDFIDVGRGVKPGTYRVVRPYPRRAFSDGESELSLNDLGLTSKQEALFLELI